jgi:hypothetical protein
MRTVRTPPRWGNDLVSPTAHQEFVRAKYGQVMRDAMDVDDNNARDMDRRTPDTENENGESDASHTLLWLSERK